MGRNRRAVSELLEKFWTAPWTWCYWWRYLCKAMRKHSKHQRKLGMVEGHKGPLYI